MRPAVTASSRSAPGNYGGKLGPHHFHLRKIMEGRGAVTDGLVAKLKIALQQRVDLSEVLAGAWTTLSPERAGQATGLPGARRASPAG